MAGLFNIDNVMSAAGAAGQMLLLFVLLKRKLYKVFPVFTTYVLFVMLADPVILVWMRFLQIPGTEMASNPLYFRAYVALKVPEYLLGLGVLVEIALNVLHPVKRSLPSGSLVLFCVLLSLGGLITYLLAGHADSGALLTRAGGLFVKVNLANAILRIACFSAIAVFAQMLGIGWKNHVLQLATGLAFYGAVDLIVELAHTHIASGGDVSVYYARYRLLDQLRVVGYLSTLTFWCWSFSRQEAPRKEFSPQMARFLVSLSAAAKRSRSQLGR